MSLDFYGPLPISTAKCAHILVTIDAFSKYVVLYPIVKANTATVIKKIENDYIPKYGKSKRILMDHGTQFTSKKLKNKLDQLDIKYTYISIRHPCANIVERTNKELGRLFRALIKLKHTEWFSKIRIIQNILNEIYHETTQFTPMELHFGKKPTRFWEKIIHIQKPNLSVEQKLFLTEQRINKKGQYRARKHKEKHKFTSFKFNDLVLIKANKVSDSSSKIIAKFLSVYEGPYKLFQKV